MIPPNIPPQNANVTGDEAVDLRFSLRSPDLSPKARQVSGSAENKGGDCIPFSGILSLSPAEPSSNEEAGRQSTSSRISQKKLVELSARLSERDTEILASLKKYRFLLTGQLQRLFFTDKSTKRKNSINTQHTLKKLREYKLIAPLKRQIGGVLGGSSSLIWYLTEPGYRLLRLADAEKYTRKRFEEPSPLFLEHTLAIAETAVQLHDICKDSEDLDLEQVDPEPSCWRPYKYNGRTAYLKPDLFAVTTYDGYEDSWFIEIDLSTESPNTVVEKCKAYISYYNTGIEQLEYDVFPMVVWIVKDKIRKERLRQYIQDGIPNRPKMFLIITPNQLEQMVRQFIDREEIV